MQPAGRLADDLLQARLHIHVDVLQRRLEGELAVLDLLQDLVQAALDRRTVLGPQDALAR